MIKLLIVNKENYEYELEDEIGQVHSLNLEFFDINEEPKKGDYIYLNNELLNPNYEGYSTSYTFGDVKSEYGKQNILMNDIDLIKIIIKDREIYLKRLYG